MFGDVKVVFKIVEEVFVIDVLEICLKFMFVGVVVSLEEFVGMVIIEYKNS